MDAQNDHLDIELINKPSTAYFNQQTQVFSWRPGLGDAGAHEITCIARDGKSSTEHSFTIHVEEYPSHLEDAKLLSRTQLRSKMPELKFFGDSALTSLRSNDIEMLRNGLRMLSDTPNTVQFYEYLRLMRHPKKEIIEHAETEFYKLMDAAQPDSDAELYKLLLSYTNLNLHHYVDSPAQIDKIMGYLAEAEEEKLFKPSKIKKVYAAVNLSYKMIKWNYAACGRDFE